ncbi:MAG: TraM recognition domain-containing protein [Bacteroidetes bacterium]|nr:TraM recognition domain-containing protein [Bacteroidota bacterium]
MKKQYFHRAFWKKLKTIGFSILIHTTDILESIGDALEQAADTLKEKDHRFKARFDQPQKLADRSGKSFSVSGDRFLSLDRARMNTLVIAPSGSGKTQVCVFPSIYHLAMQGSSMVVNDNSGELSRFIPFLKRKGYQILLIDFTFSGARDSVFFNPLARIKTKADAAKCAGILVRSTMGGEGKDAKGSFFTTKSEELLTVFIYFLITCCHPMYHNLANLLLLLEELQANPQKVEHLLSRAPEDLWRTYMSLLGSSENTRTSIVASAQAAISWIGNDPQLQYLTHTDTLNFDALRNGKTAVFVRLPIKDAEYYTVVAGLFFNNLFGHFFQVIPEKSQQDIHLILEEFSTFAAALPDFSNTLANSRKYRLPIMAVIQSGQQLVQAYGQFDAKTIQSNFNTKVYFSGLTEEAEHLERILGKYSYKADPDDKHFSTRQLMTSDEIRNMPKDTVLVLSSSFNPIKMKTKPAYRQPLIMQAWNTTDEDGECPEQGYTPIDIPLLDLSGKDIRGTSEEQ